jgi:hypothetical protein
MKKYLILIIASVFLWTGLNAQPQVTSVSAALNGTTVESMVKYFDNVLDITINNEQSTYSKAQAEMVIKSFCSKNSIKPFLSTQGGLRNENSFFIIGVVKGAGRNRYKVFLYFKQKGKANVLQQMKFELLRADQ